MINLIKHEQTAPALILQKNLPTPLKQAIKPHNTIISYSLPKDLNKIPLLARENDVPYVARKRKQQNDSTYLSQKIPLYNQQGKMVALLGLSVDIVDILKYQSTETTMQTAQEQNSLNKTIALIQNIEHDLRSPIASILSMLDHLNNIEIDKKKKEILQDTQSVTKELLKYINVIIEFSEIMNHTLPIKLKKFNLDYLIQGIINIESVVAKNKQLDLLLSYPNHVPTQMIGDRFRVYRILLGLINNAIKFTEKGCVKISVDLIKRPSEAEVIIKIVIADTGAGIEKKNCEMIFEKFTRCGLSNQGAFKGPGLGLWIVKHFVQELKGTILLESTLGQGSIFTCFLPFKLF